MKLKLLYIPIFTISIMSELLRLSEKFLIVIISLTKYF